jgi:hypothetical protein
MGMGSGRLRGVSRDEQSLANEKGRGTYANLGVEELSATTSFARNIKWKISAYIKLSASLIRLPHGNKTLSIYCK